MSLKNLTSLNIKKFYIQMAALYDASFINKEDSNLMKAVGLFLDTITVMDKEIFLKQYTTTFWGKIYLSYEVGEIPSSIKDNEKLINQEFISQISTLIHELHHVLQFKQNPFIMPLEYLLDHSKRAMFEAQAWSSGIEFKYLQGIPLKEKTFNIYANKIKNYDGTDDDVIMIKEKLKSDYGMMYQNIPVSEVVTSAIKILTHLNMWNS